MEKEAIVKSPSGRVKRTPVGSRNILTVSEKDPNYVYRIVNNTEDRVDRFIAAGYEIVGNSVEVGDASVKKSTAMGSKAEISVGGGKKAFVMRIKKEWYDEDQAEKQRQIKATEESISNPALESSYGKIEITKG